MRPPSLNFFRGPNAGMGLFMNPGDKGNSRRLAFRDSWIATSALLCESEIFQDRQGPTSRHLVIIFRGLLQDQTWSREIGERAVDWGTCAGKNPISKQWEIW